MNGIFNELYASGFPARQEQVILAGIVEWDRDEEGKQPFTIHLMDPDENPIFTIHGYSEVDARPDSRPPARTHLIFPLENLVFTSPGQYRIRMDISGQRISGPSLYLLHTSHEKDK
ncbi:hypothetical protein L0152_27465 [bacterium]|nr:hypothetical protein [bacterium]